MTAAIVILKKISDPVNNIITAHLDRKNTNTVLIGKFGVLHDKK